MLLVESNSAQAIHKNVIFHLESLISKLNLYPTEVLVEILNYLVKHDRLEDARELLSIKHRSITRKCIKVLPYVDQNLRCIEFLLNYITWEQQVLNQDTKLICDVSTQGWIVNAIVHLRSVIGNYEYFVIAVTRMLLFYSYNKKAYLFVSEFMRNNPLNTSAQLLLLNLLVYLNQNNAIKYDEHEENTMDCMANEEELETNRVNDLEKLNNFSSDQVDEMIDLKLYPTMHDKETALENLRKTDASQHVLMKHSDESYSVHRLKDLLDGLEYLVEVRSKSRWKRIRVALEELFENADAEAIEETKVLWRTNYQPYWAGIDFVELAGQDLSRSRKRLIREVSESLRNKLEN